MAKSEFERSSPSNQTNVFKELLGFLAHNKKWWLAPVLIVILLLGALIILGGSAAAPFIYTLF